MNRERIVAPASAGVKDPALLLSDIEERAEELHFSVGDPEIQHPFGPGPLDDEAAIEESLKAWRECYEVQGAAEEYQLRRLVIEALRIDRCFREECTRQADLIHKARTRWENDRETEVQTLAAKLHRNPERWIVEIRKSTQGCEWLISQWKGLRNKLKSPGGWDKREQNRALDLMGTPYIFRDAHSPICPPEGAPENYLELLIDQQIAEIEEWKEKKIRPYDDWTRHAQEEGRGFSLDKGVMAIRRFESGCHRRLERLMEKLECRRIARPRASNPAKPAVQGQSLRQTPAPAPAVAVANKPDVNLIKEIKAVSCASKPHETEWWTILPAAEPMPVTAAKPAPQAAKPAPVPAKVAPLKEFAGNRQQRRKAAAMARSRG